jgi:hypothetical protein
MTPNTISLLEKNYSWFKNHKDELNLKYPRGGHVLIWECKLIGVWESRSKALTEGIKKLGNVPFLIRNLNEEDAHQVNFSVKAVF